MAKCKRNKQHNFESLVPKTRERVEIKPITQTQSEYLHTIRNHDISFGIGPAGTGKTYLATLMAMQYFTEGDVDKIVICRPAIDAGEKLGFLPGDINQKMDPYVRPIYDTFQTYWSQNTIRDHLGKGTIEISPLAYMRGRTFDRTFIIADEMQNATADQLLMLLTRLGKGSKMVVTGDPVQSDVNGSSCFNMAHNVLSSVDTVDFIRFGREDVVRHPTVKKVLDAWFSKDGEVPEKLGQLAI